MTDMNLQLDHSSGIPLHQQAENILRELIKQPEYQQGKLLPNEVELAQLLNISRNTLRQAILRLTYEGLLVRKRNVGTYVAPTPVMSNARNWMSFSQEMSLMGMQVCNFELHLSREPAPSEAIDFFKVEETELLVCLDRLRGCPEYPFVRFVSYFNPIISFKGMEDFSSPLYKMLENNFGIVAKTSREQISAAAADVELARKLQINTGDPILIRRRFVYDVNDCPVEYNIGYYRSDCFTYTIESSNV